MPPANDDTTPTTPPQEPWKTPESAPNEQPGAAPIPPKPEEPVAGPSDGTDADGYYGEEPAGQEDLDLSFLDEEKQQDPVQDTPKAP